MIEQARDRVFSAVDDASLVRSVVAGEPAAFELLMRRYNRRLYRVARAVLRSDEEAEDALQEAYLSAFRSIGQFRQESALSTWLSRLVLNQCLGRLRRSARRQNVIPIVSSNTASEINAMPDDAEGPDQALGRAQMRALLERKLDALPESFRVVFVLRSVEDLSVEETALCLNIPAGTVRSRYSRAKSLLREALAQEVDLAEQDLYQFGGEHCDRVTAMVLRKLKS
ncbi:MAG TPA: RNA polymerase sigma factor [Steroidobacteraceae bacterium]|jgi:RNA polymerase sigma-70 factor (ECF subfamily)